jgi:hypothetical protein
MRNTGGPAFPAPAGVSHITEQGMTLRDYFAAKALQSIMGKSEMLLPDWALHDLDVAEVAYEFADAMLKARQSNG